MDLNQAEVAVTTQHLIDMGQEKDNLLQMSDFSDMGEFLCTCSELFPEEETPEYRYTRWEEIPDLLINREWLCSNFFFVHVIFPSEVRYVDLGSPDLIAGKADGAENVIRVKATVRNFPNETNISVITEDGSFYTFNVKYASEPLLLNVEMCDFIHDGEKVNRPNNAQEIYLKELGSESPMLVRLIMKSIHKQNKREVKHIGCKRFGIQYLLKGIYTHNGLLYFHTEIKNQSNVPFDVDYITWKIVDKKVAKRTAVQEQIILPLRAQNYATLVPGRKSERTVFTMAKFTIPDGKCLVVELNEKNGGRHQSFVIENEDLVRAGTINELQVR